jgi:hypothetical protein
VTLKPHFQVPFSNQGIWSKCLTNFPVPQSLHLKKRLILCQRGIRVLQQCLTQ